MPTMSRPPDSTSTDASCFARINGWRSGRMMMPVPSRMRPVRAATYASVGTGSSISDVGASGDGGAWGSISTGCSPTQTDSYPRSSAAAATSATPSASAANPDPIPNHPTFMSVLPCSWRHPTDACQSDGVSDGPRDAPSPFRDDVLAGQVAFVTGGGTGIGKEIGRVLGHHGARVAIASRKREVLEATAAELRAEGIDVHVDVFDVRDAEAARRVVDGIVEHFGRLDVLVNNAAGNFPAPISKISPNGFKAVVDIDLLGTYNVSKAAFEAWMGEHGGNVVNISAPFELKGAAMQAHVAAAKAGVDSLTRTCAVEW